MHFYMPMVPKISQTLPPDLSVCTKFVPDRLGFAGVSYSQKIDFQTPKDITIQADISYTQETDIISLVVRALLFTKLSSNFDVWGK